MVNYLICASKWLKKMYTSVVASWTSPLSRLKTGHDI